MTILGKHTCHARPCNVEIPPKMFMCKRHWFMLPKTMRDAIWANYRPGQEIDKEPSAKYLEVAMAAVNWLSDKEASTT
jgi:hypothetical protein